METILQGFKAFDCLFRFVIKPSSLILNLSGYEKFNHRTGSVPLFCGIILLQQ